MAASKQGISAATRGPGDRRHACIRRATRARVEAWTQRNTSRNGGDQWLYDHDLRNGCAAGGVWRHVMHCWMARLSEQDRLRRSGEARAHCLRPRSPPAFRVTANSPAWEARRRSPCAWSLNPPRCPTKRPRNTAPSRVCTRHWDAWWRIWQAWPQREIVARTFAERAIVITREFDAPRELVFKAWTDPKHIAQWWRPKGSPTPCANWTCGSAAPGISLCAPQRHRISMRGVYREVVEPERLVFTNIATDKEGKLILDGLTTVTFAERAAARRYSRWKRAPSP